jgi:hypothetical protein
MYACQYVNNIVHFIVTNLKRTKCKLTLNNLIVRTIWAKKLNNNK